MFPIYTKLFTLVPTNAKLFRVASLNALAQRGLAFVNGNYAIDKELNPFNEIFVFVRGETVSARREHLHFYHVHPYLHLLSHAVQAQPYDHMNSVLPIEHSP